MKAAAYTEYGSPDVLHLTEVEKPSPQDNEVLIKIHASTVTSGDARMRGADFPPVFALPARMMFGFTKPRKTRPGTEFAGEIEAIGKDVTRFKVGDAVYGMSSTNFGAHAEYLCLSEDAPLAIKPENIPYNEAAAIPFGGLTALYYLRELGHIQSGQKVLVYGASGSVGTAMVQLAKHFGADVTGVCSTSNLDLVKSLGADYVIDYTQEDYAQSSEIYDIIVDTVGKTSFAHAKGVLKEDGRFLAVVLDLASIVQMVRGSIAGGKKVLGGVASEKIKDLVYLKELIEADEYQAVVDRCYPLEQIVEAHRYVDSGRKRGNVVITVTQGNAE